MVIQKKYICILFVPLMSETNLIESSELLQVIYYKLGWELQ